MPNSERKELNERTDENLKAPEIEREFVFQRYTGVTDITGETVRGPWKELKPIFLQHQHRGQPSDGDCKEALERGKMGPGIVLAEFAPGKTRKGSNVVRVHALGLDYDDFTTEAGALLVERLNGYEFVIHTTHSSGAAVKGGGIRARVIVPVLAPIEAERYPAVVNAFHKYTGDFADPATRDIGRLLFEPSTFDPELSEANECNGRFFDVEEDIPLEYFEQAEKRSTRGAPADSRSTTGSSEIWQNAVRVASRKDTQAHTFQIAAESYNRDNPIDFAEHGRTCPVCKHNDCFGPLPDSDGRASCFSTDHGTVGLKGKGVYHMDALDIDAHLAGVNRRSHLEGIGYIQPKPEIVCYPGSLPAQIRAGIDALSKYGKLFQRGGNLVKLAPEAEGETLDIVRVHKESLTEDLADAADWRRPPNKEGVKAKIDPPPKVVSAIHKRMEWNEVPYLSGVSSIPILLPNGDLIREPGYDSNSKLFLALVNGMNSGELDYFNDNVRESINYLQDVFVDFPLGSGASLSTILAALFSVVARYAYSGKAPFFVFESHTPGAGKSLIADVISLIAFGHRAAMSPFVSNDDEFRKSITAQVINGSTMAVIDNVASGARLDMPSLNNAITSENWRDRVLGLSEMVTLPMRIVWMANGNNLVISGDLARRTLRCRLEVEEERPELRKNFKHDPLTEHVLNNRQRLVACVLTVVREYIRAGLPDVGVSPLGSFEGWSRVIRNSIIWAGQPDPVDNLVNSEPDADPDRGARGMILREVLRIQTENEYLTSRDILKRVNGGQGSALGDALVELSKSKDIESLKTITIGRTLGTLVGRWQLIDTEDGPSMCRIERHETKTREGAVRWFVLEKKHA